MPKSRFTLYLVLPVTALILLVMAPLVTGQRTLFQRDVHQVHLPMKQVQAEAFRDGRLPWIDPTRGGGQPMLGNLNAVPLYPTNLLYLVAPTVWALNAHFWLHWLAALAAFYGLGRAWGLRRTGAWAGAVTYALSGWFLSHLVFYNLISGIALAPALIAALLAGADPAAPRTRRRWMIPAVGILWALLLVSGDPLMAALALAAGGAALYARHGLRIPEWKPLLAAGVCGTLIALPQLVEFRRILEASFRGFYGYDLDARTAASFDPRQAVEWLFPFFFGLPDTVGYGRFWGQRFYTDWQPYFYSLAPGVTSLALVAAAGLPRWRRLRNRPSGGRSDRAAAWGWGLAAVGLFFALGRFNPLVPLLLELPGGGLLRFPVKVWLWVSLGLGLVAGLGFERLRLPAARRRALVAVGLLAGTYLAAWGLLATAPTLVEDWQEGLLPSIYTADFFAFERDRWAGAARVGLAILAAFALALGLRRRRPVTAAALVLFVHAASQLQIHAPSYRQVPAETLRRPPAIAAAGLLTEESRILQDDEFSRPKSLARGNYPDDRVRWLMLRTYEEMYWWSGALRGYRYELNVSPEGLDAFLSVAAGRMVEDFVADPAARLRLYAAWGIDRLITGQPLDPALLGETADARLLRAGEVLGNPVWVYALPRAAPPVSFVPRVERAPHVTAAVVRLTDPAHDPTTTVILPGEGPTVGAMEAAHEAGAARLIAQSPDRLVAEVAAPTPGAVVVQRAHLPLYRAWLDGVETTLEPANLYRMAVEVPAGDHRVEIAVDKRPFRRALGGTALGLVGLLLLGLFAGRSTGPR